MRCHSALNIKEEELAKNHSPSTDANIAIKERTKMFTYHSTVGKQIYDMVSEYLIDCVKKIQNSSLKTKWFNIEKC